MEGTTWTNDRLDDLAEAMRTGFARVDQDIRELRADINGLKRAIMGVGGGIIVTLIGVIGAMFASGT